MTLIWGNCSPPVLSQHTDGGDSTGCRHIRRHCIPSSTTSDLTTQHRWVDKTCQPGSHRRSLTTKASTTTYPGDRVVAHQRSKRYCGGYNHHLDIVECRPAFVSFRFRVPRRGVNYRPICRLPQLFQEANGLSSRPQEQHHDACRCRSSQVYLIFTTTAGSQPLLLLRMICLWTLKPFTSLEKSELDWQSTSHSFEINSSRDRHSSLCTG
ncbi:hypothetical protein CONLIGDRAFT_74755 [Coniochaeta ligniaria NRRL 30616]|uniref:Uncharacterized protein n=1 Tax=Coniochaeta ligniaria NRRL 30616 TaxID=1408157 RepID=A0A1J7IC61_9PEZI|nr:hypothetical protein CONLIGDRAFT_74755 [Coniochaeta ligniaria NRRL 30616]